METLLRVKGAAAGDHAGPAGLSQDRPAPRH